MPMYDNAPQSFVSTDATSRSFRAGLKIEVSRNPESVSKIASGLPDDILASENPLAAESVGELLVELFTGNAACPSIYRSRLETLRETSDRDARMTSVVDESTGRTLAHEKALEGTYSSKDCSAAILSTREKPEFEGRTVAHVLANAGHPFFHEFPPEVKNLVWTWTNPLTGEKTSLTVEETFARRKEFEAKKRSRQGDAR